MRRIKALIVTAAVLTLACLFSAAVIAHPAYGTERQMLHEIEHLFWLGAGITLVFYIVYWTKIYLKKTVSKN